MDQGQKISVKVGENTYSVTARNEDMEAFMRLAAKKFSENLDAYILKYPKYPMEQKLMLAGLDQTYGRLIAEARLSSERKDIEALRLELEQYLCGKDNR